MLEGDLKNLNIGLWTLDFQILPDIRYACQMRSTISTPGRGVR
jgi:hypothetical protein